MKKKSIQTMAVLSAAMLLAAGFAGCSNPGGTGNVPEPVSEPLQTATSEDPGILTPDEPVAEATTEEDYLAFIEGNAKIKAAGDNMFGLVKDSEYTLDDVMKSINAAYDEFFGPGYKAIVEVDYAFIDCGNDGVPEMALCVVGDSEERNDEMNDYYIVKKIDGELLVVDYFEAYYRSWGELNKYGVFLGSGSGGASLHINDYKRVNAAGEHEFIYSCETEFAMKEAMLYGVDIPSDIELPEGYPYIPDDTGEIEREKYSFVQSEEIFIDESPELDAYLRQLMYVFHDARGNQIFPSEENQKIYSEAGILITDDATMKQRISDRLSELGISEVEMSSPSESPDAAPGWIVAWDGLEPQMTEAE